MTKDELTRYLLEMIETSDSMSGEYVIIGKKQAVEIARLLAGKEELEIPKDTDGKTLFFCADCARSFWAAAREDEDCFRKYKYHTWYASCPSCGREVSRNDRYWR